MYSDAFLDTLQTRLVRQPVARAAVGDRLAGVCLLLMEGEPGDADIVFTKRAADLSRHPGEISFPGGIEHDEDDDLAGTALRELDEELGIEPAGVRVLGGLAPVHTYVSAVLMVPFVGVLSSAPDFRPNPGEIESVFRSSVEELMRIEQLVEMERGGVRFQTHVYEVDGHTIWGATGHVLHDFLGLMREVLPG
jgi:8-oxo-dGTP pyrophosphatase MutT (NUDIX family)